VLRNLVHPLRLAFSVFFILPVASGGRQASAAAQTPESAANVSNTPFLQVSNPLWRIASGRPAACAQTAGRLSFFARLCRNVRYLSKFCYQVVLKFSFQLFNYKSFICVVNETKRLKLTG
jgi:hypothetical protein